MGHGVEIANGITVLQRSTATGTTGTDTVCRNLYQLSGRGHANAGVMYYAPGFPHSQTHNLLQERRTVKVSFIEDTDGRVFLVFTNTIGTAPSIYKANIIVHNATGSKRCLNLVFRESRCSYKSCN